MGLLDELEREAERQRQEEARQAALREQRERAWADKLEPAMRALEAYLRQLTEKLAFIKKRIRVVFPLHGYGEVVAYVEPNFVIRSEPGKLSHEITVEMIGQVASEECPAIVADSMTRVRTLQSILQQVNLGGLSDTRKNPNGDVIAGRFQAKGKIPMALNVRADLESGVARFGFVNLEGFGQSSRQFTPEQLSAEMFDALGRFLTREDLRFAQESVSEDVRRQLQSKIARDQLRREWEGKLARQLGEDEARVVQSLDPAARPSWVLGKLRLMSVKLFGR
jgi:hypothetical protein